jgi:hypothetical protein
MPDTRMLIGEDNLDDQAQDQELDNELEDVEEEELDIDELLGQSDEDPFKGKFKTQAEKDKAHLEAEKKLTEQAQELSKLKNFVQDAINTAGVSDETELKMAKVEEDLLSKYEYGLAVANQNLQQAVTSGQLTPAQKEAQLSAFAVRLEVAMDAERNKEKGKLNMAQIERLGTAHKDLLNIASIKKASQHFIGSTIKRGELLDANESDNLFSFGKEIYQEGFQAGLAAARGKKVVDQDKKGLKSVASSTKNPNRGTINFNNVDAKALGKKIEKMTDAQYALFRTKHLGFTDD